MSKAYPCVYCTDDLRCTKYTNDGAVSFCVLGPCRDARPSRADQIRYMSDKELASVFAIYADCKLCKAVSGHCDRDFPECKGAWLEWLKKEADT